MNVFYVYLLIDPRTMQPFYVGKGKDNRMLVHEIEAIRNYKSAVKPHHTRIREILSEGLTVVYDKVLINTSDGEALNRERELIKQYGRVSNGTGLLLNITKGGQNRGGTEYSVSQYTRDGTLVAKYDSAKEAALCVPQANRSYITQCCKRKRVSSGGFLWAYTGDPTPVFTKKYYSKVRQSTTEGAVVGVYESVTAASKATNISLHAISECCRGNSKTSGGYVWSYV